MTPDEQQGNVLKIFYIHDHGRPMYGERRTIDHFVSSAARGPLLHTQLRGALGGPHLPVELRTPAYDDAELGYKLREVDELRFDKHF